MSKNFIAIAYVLVMVALIVGVDFAYLRDHLWLRLAVNVGFVLLFACGYFLFIRPRA